MVLGSVATGALLGFSLAAPPGPMNAVIAAETVDRGWRAGVAAGLGAMSADATFFVLALAGLVEFVRAAPTLRRAMVAVGGLLMLYFAYGALRGARGGLDDAAGSAGRGFTKAFALALTNPYQITWWLTVGVGLLTGDEVAFAGLSVTVESGLPTVVGFFGGIAVWITGFPTALRVAGDRVAALERGVGYASAAVLAWFGVSFLASAV